MAANVLTSQKIISCLRECGYKGGSIYKNYTYVANAVEREIAAVGFASTHYESGNACIGVIDGSQAEEDNIERVVQSHQGLGAPVILVCLKENLQFWHFYQGHAVNKENVKSQKLDAFFSKYQKDFDPERILRAKKLGRINKKYQLEFVDLGLMPFIEKQEGEYIAGQVERIIKTLAGNNNKDAEAWHFQAAFWLIGAKILQDKEVADFVRLDIGDIDAVIDKVRRHYNAMSQLRIPKGKKALVRQVARDMVKNVSSFSHLTIDSLAYVYENTLVTKATRKAFGTHATPSWLVNYIVWQMADWIEAIPQDERIILEPACGHAPFLTAGARLLSFMYKGAENKRHDYLKSHLVGIELDSFASEIARLSLTLADLPNPDGWKIINHDIYSEDTLAQAARNSTILFCNPAFEYIKKDEEHYLDFETGNKAAEVLARTLPYMPDNSVFGVILPQGFLHKKNLADLRKSILDDFEVRTICRLPENVFSQAGHPSAVLLGRKKKSKKKINYITVSKNNLKHFIDRYQATEELLEKEIFQKAPGCSFRIPELNHIWAYCATYGKLCNVADVGQGLVFKGRDLPPRSVTVNEKPFKGGVKGFCSYSRTIKTTELPDEVYLNLSSEVIRRPQWGTAVGKPQILLNYIRAGSGPWRLKAWLDKEGHPVTSNFLVMRPVDNCIWTLNSLWALANSPFANAYVYCDSLERNNTAGTLRSMPVPQVASHDIERLDTLVSKYFTLSKQQGKFMSGEEDELKEEKKACLLKIDAEVLRLYDLPPRLEKQLLDFFAGYQRKGVDFAFDRYYPEGFEAYIPLRMYLSDEFQNATVENVKQWVDETRSPEIIKAFENASKDFDGE